MVSVFSTPSTSRNNTFRARGEAAPRRQKGTEHGGAAFDFSLLSVTVGGIGGTHIRLDHEFGGSSSKVQQPAEREQRSISC
mmetsp:Transcript_4202/g.13069  ORF Transcript_4202/g.13069 Transcript_4202/m.13069 type:complete len:81 (-) Transcript_4202:13-255(-)